MATSTSMDGVVSKNNILHVLMGGGRTPPQPSVHYGLPSAITFFNDFDCFCHFELEKIRDEDPAITFLNDVDRFLRDEEGQTYFGNVLGGRHK